MSFQRRLSTADDRNRDAVVAAWRWHGRRCQELSDAYERALDLFIASKGAAPCPVEPSYPPFPEICRGMACDATTRAGSPCLRTDIYSCGRCKFHGGLSTGPRTPAGKERAQANLLLGRHRPRIRPGVRGGESHREASAAACSMGGSV